jgi:MOSC domain-containing protein YiiM
MQSHVVAVSRSSTHSFSKACESTIELVAGHGVLGDAHSGVTVKHRSRVARDPTQPNLRQVHLIHGELFDELQQKGFTVEPGQLGENIITLGIDLLALPTGTALHIGRSAIIALTGLRNPCGQLDDFQPGLLAAVLDRSPNGDLIRKAGVMGIVLAGGLVQCGDPITAHLPDLPHKALERV